MVYTPLLALYDSMTEAEPFLETIETRGDNGKSNAAQNTKDAGCRHLSFYNLPDQLNSMCFFTQNVFTGTKYIQNLIEQMDQARISRNQQGVGVSFLDATPNIAIEATSSKGSFSFIKLFTVLFTSHAAFSNSSLFCLILTKHFDRTIKSS